MHDWLQDAKIADMGMEKIIEVQQDANIAEVITRTSSRCCRSAGYRGPSAIPGSAETNLPGSGVCHGCHDPAAWPIDFGVP